MSSVLKLMVPTYLRLICWEQAVGLNANDVVRNEGIRKGR
jgi:hypothetical protein